MATELATDIIVNVGDVKFYLHKVVSHTVLCTLVDINLVAMAHG